MAAAEVALLLLQDKLRILNFDEVIFYPGLRTKLEDAIQKLNEISLLLKHQEEKHEGDPALEADFLSAIQVLEDVTDVFRLKREQQRRMRSLLLTPWWSLSPLLRQKYLNHGISKFISHVKMIKDEHKVISKSQDQKPKAKEISSFFSLQKLGYDGKETSNHWEKISYYAERETTIIGRDREIDELTARLINHKDEENDDEIRIIPVVGEAGCGKTSLVRYVYNSLHVKNHFEVRAWVHVSSDYIYRSFKVDLLRQTSSIHVKDVYDMDDYKLTDVIVRNLMGKRYLVVLDDVAHFEAWHKLAVAFPDARNGSCVILTTRDPSVANSSDLWISPFQLYKLSDEGSRMLLQNQLKEAETCSSALEDRIINLCQGLPMNIVLLGGILSTAEPSELSSIIEDLESNIKHQSTTLNVFALSYDKLQPALRPCFSYLSLFPKTFNVPLRRLLGLWQAEGLLPHKENVLPEDLAVMCFETLVTRNIVEVTRWQSDGSPRTCRMPGLIHDFFHLKYANADPFHFYRSVDKEYSSIQPSSVRRVVELFEIKCSLDSLTDQHLLRSFVSFNTLIQGAPQTDVGSFLKTIVEKKGFALLKALDLEGVYKPQLPGSLEKLYLLRYLGLRLTVLDSLPKFIGYLPCLETLDVKYTNIAALPISIWKAKNLRHLHMNVVCLDFFHHKPSRILLNNLLTLTGLYVCDKKVVTDVLGKLISLRKLGLTCLSSTTEAVAEWISHMTNLQSLKLKVVSEDGQPSKLELTRMTEQKALSKLYLMGSLVRFVKLSELFPPSLSIITLSMSQLMEDPMEVLGKLKYLKILKLLAFSYKGERMTCLQGDFPKLRVLKLWNLELKEFVVEESAMPKLEELEIRGCDNLKTCRGLEEVSFLKELVLTNMHEDFIVAIKNQMKSHVFVKVDNWMVSTA